MPIDFLVHPLARNLDINAPSTTVLRRGIIREKVFLRRIYEEWYRTIAAEVPAGPGRVLEVGSGAGFLADYLPGLITSEILTVPGLNMTLDCREMPFRTGSMRAIVMTEVLHHIPDVSQFFDEAARCIRPGGVIVSIEPWNTPWSKLVWSHMHHEPFYTDAPRWDFPSSGPLSGANGALPWIVFERDQSVFRERHPEWTVVSVRPRMPFRYLLSGGLGYRSLMPGWTFPMWRGLEKTLQPWMRHLAMFACIVLKRR